MLGTTSMTPSDPESFIHGEPIPFIHQERMKFLGSVGCDGDDNLQFDHKPVKKCQKEFLIGIDLTFKIKRISY